MTAVNKARQLIAEATKKQMAAKQYQSELQAKETAKWVVDEIISAIKSLQYNRKTDYWEEVKREIELL